MTPHIYIKVKLSLRHRHKTKLNVPYKYTIINSKKIKKYERQPNKK